MIGRSQTPSRPLLFLATLAGTLLGFWLCASAEAQFGSQFKEVHPKGDPDRPVIPNGFSILGEWSSSAIDPRNGRSRGKVLHLQPQNRFEGAGPDVWWNAGNASWGGSWKFEKGKLYLVSLDGRGYRVYHVERIAADRMVVRQAGLPLATVETWTRSLPKHLSSLPGHWTRINHPRENTLIINDDGSYTRKARDTASGGETGGWALSAYKLSLNPSTGAPPRTYNLLRRSALIMETERLVNGRPMMERWTRIIRFDQ
jgi:hypothetical protein